MTYDLLSRFYDLENADFVEDLDFWVGLAKESGGPVLELGCGSGRVTQQIARAGITIVGLDNSEPMLALARAKLNRKPELAARSILLLGDMTNFLLETPILQSQTSNFKSQSSSQLPNHPTTQPPNHPARFPLIISPFNTFMHLLTAADQHSMLHCARRCLAPGGQLVLDLTNPIPVYSDPPSETLTLERTLRDDANDLTIQQFSATRLDRTAQLAHILWHYDSIAADGSMKRALVPISLRYTFPAEMSLLLERSGLRLAHLYRDYDDSPLTDDSERMIVVAEPA
ncbi:MAG: class I SAM-dependent methyltransferase [Chloroflexi bacterium]|nr:class I SAM-dependent methyltransferase [Chloroflexota bacterium]